MDKIEFDLINCENGIEQIIHHLDDYNLSNPSNTGKQESELDIELSTIESQNTEFLDSV